MLLFHLPPKTKPKLLTKGTITLGPDRLWQTLLDPCSKQIVQSLQNEKIAVDQQVAIHAMGRSAVKLLRLES